VEFAPLPDVGQTGEQVEFARAQGHWREADLKRAIAVAEKAGLTAYRIEIEPDGTIVIIVGPAVIGTAAS
jgi:hypothetical protein